MNSISRFILNCRRFSSSNNFDLVVIGSGPGGYVASIKASQLGLKTACVEKSRSLGGTCLNIGCIPSKSLLNSSYHYHLIHSGKLKDFGVDCQNVDLNFERMLSNKDNVVSTLTSGIAQLFKHNKIERIEGSATITGVGSINVIKSDGSNIELKTNNIIIATGSDSISFPGIDIDEKNIVTSTGALSLQKVPKKMVVIGGGVIGLELGSVYRRLGSDVTIIEFMKNIGGANIDSDVSKCLMNVLKKDGIKFLLNHKVKSARKLSDGNVHVEYENMADNNKFTIDCDVLLVSVGRRPYTDGLGIDKIGIKTDNKNRIIVDSKFQTNLSNIYAIGDCIPGAMLAHKAEDEGIACVEGITGQPVHINYSAVPSVIYTHPEVAWVGLSEDEAKASNIQYRIGKFPLAANGRSRAVGEIDGFAKIITQSTTDKIIGAHFIASCAGEVINQMAMAIEYGASAEDVARVCHAHPTVAECIKEACLSAYFGKPINST